MSEQNKIDMNYYKIRDVIDSKDSVSQKSMDLFLMLLKPQQREILECIPRGILNAVSAKDIKDMTGFPTKNISSQIKQIGAKIPISIKEESNGYKKYFIYDNL